MANEILTPITLWEGFDDSLPFKETVLKTETIGNAVFNYFYFSGRSVAKKRVRIYGVYAKQKNTKSDTIVILPSVSEGADVNLVSYFSSLGFNVLTVDLRGKVDGETDFTVYPDEISYANYEQRGRRMDYVDTNARETSWYEWCAVARYAVSYAKADNPNGKIGVLGLKHGANVAWQLTATDDRVNAAVFAFGAGWLAYKGVDKFSQEEIELDDERCRFIAGVDAHSYAQLVKVPVLYLGATNSPEFDPERAIDTLQRVNNQNKSWHNFVNSSFDTLDRYCLTDVQVFFQKYLSSKRVKFPSVPKISLEVDGEDVVYTVEFSNVDDVKSVHVYASSNAMNASERVWFMPPLESSKEGECVFRRRLHGFVDFEIAYAVVKYNSGLALSSKFVFENVNINSNSKIPNVIFSSSRLMTTFIVDDFKGKKLGNTFTVDKLREYVNGPLGILGVSTKNTLISYAIKEFGEVLNDKSFIKFDVFTQVADTVTIKLLSKSGFEYATSVKLLGQNKWQNLTVEFSEFKTDIGMPIKNFDDIYSIAVSSQGGVAVNNFLVL
ncbi:MAG: dienelactone hydrolase family protein [Clostridia bacterium]|nr:dienelactone hydrolase family protein [Clostridia bacterium]